MTEKANPYIVILRETQYKSSGTVNATELVLLRAATCINLMSTNVMKRGTVIATTAK